MMVALRIRHRREQLGLKQIDLAHISKLSQAQISRYEAGTSEPTAHALYQLARALQTSADWIIGLTDEVNEIGGEQDLSEIEREIFHMLRSKSRDQQKKLLEIARLL